ncbi:uncharacterized protein DEA37_0004597 [Paragonimus westermani]|uniref:Uncharacterized protein n=1 Tax=Paragonimus westermani TaxID=34504 RepID=A0A5J4NEF1_9TREM|nr:uncharacterized protein DEA37_0004597 [Paragonimus westermani]
MNRCDSTCGPGRRRDPPKLQLSALLSGSYLSGSNDEVEDSLRLSSLVCAPSLSQELSASTQTTFTVTLTEAFRNLVRLFSCLTTARNAAAILKSNHAPPKDPQKATCGGRFYVGFCRTVQPVCAQIVRRTQQPALTLTKALPTVEADVPSSAAACCDTSHTPAENHLVDTCTQPSSTICFSSFSPKPDPSDCVSTRSSLGAIRSSQFGTFPSKSEFRTIQSSQLHLTQSVLSSSTASVQYTVSENPATRQPTSKSAKVLSILTKSEQQLPAHQPNKVRMTETRESNYSKRTPRKFSPCSQKPEGDTHFNTPSILTTTKQRANMIHTSHVCSNRNANPVIIHPINKPITRRPTSVVSKKHGSSSATLVKRSRSSELPKQKSMVPTPRKNLQSKAATITTSHANSTARKNGERNAVKLYRTQTSHISSAKFANACDVQYTSKKPKLTSRESRFTQTLNMASCGVKSHSKRLTSLKDSQKILANLDKVGANTKPTKRATMNKDEISHFSGDDSSLTTAGILALAETSDLLGDASIRTLDRELNRLCFEKNVAALVSSEHGRKQRVVGDAVSNRFSFMTTEPSAFPVDSVLHPPLSVCNFPTVPLWPPFTYLSSVPAMEDLLKFYHHIQHSPSPHPTLTAAYPTASTLMTPMLPSYHPWYLGASPDLAMIVKNQSNHSHPRRMRANSAPSMVRYPHSRIPRIKVC